VDLRVMIWYKCISFSRCRPFSIYEFWLKVLLMMINKESGEHDESGIEQVGNSSSGCVMLQFQGHLVLLLHYFANKAISASVPFGCNDLLL